MPVGTALTMSRTLSRKAATPRSVTERLLECSVYSVSEAADRAATRTPAMAVGTSPAAWGRSGVVAEGYLSLTEAATAQPAGPEATRLVRSHFAVVDRATCAVVVVDPGDGSRRLPWLDGWDEELERLRTGGQGEAGSAGPGEGLTGIAPPPLTMLTSWVSAQETAGATELDPARETELVHALYLCEAAPGHEGAGPGTGQWSPGEPLPDGLPQELAAALQSLPQLLPERGALASSPPWPVFNLPGFTLRLAALLDEEPAVQRYARLSRGDAPDPRDLRQVRGWCLSSVWLNDEVVLKVTQPLWPLEPLLTSWLSSRVPDLVPEVLASGALLCRAGTSAPWFLQRRCTRPPVTGTEGAETQGVEVEERRRSARLAVVAALARIQGVGWRSGHELRRLGVEDRSPHLTGAELGLLWGAEDLRRLTPQERDRLPLLDGWLRARLDELQDRRGPVLLSHGDLHLGNVIEQATGAPAVIDWTDAAMAWPGVDLLTLLRFETKASAARDELIAAYATALTEQLGLGQEPLVELITAGLELAPVYHAVSYARIERALPEALRWHFAGTIAALVRDMLSAMDEVS